MKKVNRTLAAALAATMLLALTACSKGDVTSEVDSGLAELKSQVTEPAVELKPRPRPKPRALTLAAPAADPEPAATPEAEPEPTPASASRKTPITRRPPA